AAAQITSADPEIVMRIEAEGLIARPSQSAKYRYQLLLPEGSPPAERVCIVCGATFVPHTSQVRTCGRSCGGRARFMSEPGPAPTCTRCGGPSCGLRLCQGCRDAVGTLRARLRTIGVLCN